MNQSLPYSAPDAIPGYPDAAISVRTRGGPATLAGPAARMPPCPRTTVSPSIPSRCRALASGAGVVPRAGQADGGDLQPGLRLLLLPGQGGALPGQHVPDDRAGAGGLHLPTPGRAPHPRGDHRLAGRRAHDDGPGLLPARAGDRRAAPAPGPGHRAHDPDQCHPDRRRVGGVPGRARLPRRRLHRRAGAPARHLPAGQGRQADLRPGGPRAADPAGPRGPLERADHDQLRQRGPPAGGVPVPARRAWR